MVTRFHRHGEFVADSAHVVFGRVARVRDDGWEYAAAMTIEPARLRAGDVVTGRVETIVITDPVDVAVADRMVAVASTVYRTIRPDLSPIDAGDVVLAAVAHAYPYRPTATDVIVGMDVIAGRWARVRDDAGMDRVRALVAARDRFTATLADAADVARHRRACGSMAALYGPDVTSTVAAALATPTVGTAVRAWRDGVRV